MEKKFVALLAGCMVLASASMSMALGVNAWKFDLSTALGGTAGTYTNVDRLDVSGSSVVVQKTPLGVGKTFTESGDLGVVKGYYEPGNFVDQFNLNTNGYNLYFHTSALTGKIETLIPGGYTYSFTPGPVTMSLVADTDLNFANGVFATLATFGIVAPSGGTNVGFLGGLGPNGTTDITALFTYAKPGVFSYNGNDFAAEITAGRNPYGLLNTNNQIDALKVGPTSTNITVHSAGQFGVQPAPVPEPGTFALLGAGLLGLAIAAKRRSKI